MFSAFCVWVSFFNSQLHINVLLSCVEGESSLHRKLFEQDPSVGPCLYFKDLQ